MQRHIELTLNGYSIDYLIFVICLLRDYLIFWRLGLLVWHYHDIIRWQCLLRMFFQYIISWSGLSLYCSNISLVWNNLLCIYHINVICCGITIGYCRVHSMGPVSLQNLCLSYEQNLNMSLRGLRLGIYLCHKQLEAEISMTSHHIQSVLILDLLPPQ